MEFSLIETSVVPDYKGKGAGKLFEKDTLDRLHHEEDLQECSFGRYGVQAAIRGRDAATGKVDAQVMQSLPDIEGVLPNGRQCIWDNKVVSGPSLDLSKYRIELRGSKARQLEHLFKRSMFNAICGFLVHFNSRESKTISEPADTFWLIVHPRMRIWQQYDAGEITNFKRADCAENGIRIKWTKSVRERKYRPDVLSVLLDIAGKERVK